MNRTCSPTQIICLRFSYTGIPRRVCSLPIEVLVFLREMLRLAHIGSGKFAKKIKKKRSRKEGNRALPVARGRLYTPAGYLLTVNTTTALCTPCTHCGQMDAKSPLLLQFSSQTEVSAVAAIVQRKRTAINRSDIFTP